MRDSKASGTGVEGPEMDEYVFFAANLLSHLHAIWCLFGVESGVPKAGKMGIREKIGLIILSNRVNRLSATR